jgi:DNA polymerase-4
MSSGCEPATDLAEPPTPERKIVHVDMDCFYAAVELRERPELRGRPVAVGGSSGRGVLTTCNYEARAYGCRSAMPVFKARELYPQLVVLPVRFDLYRAESARIREIFACFTELVEPLSLDEAYLDLSHLRSEGAVLAAEIRGRIREETGLTASAGIAPNKFLAKIASDWRKPDGQFEIRAEDIEAFLAPLPVERLWGVGKATAARLRAYGIATCGELRERSEIELAQRFGKFGRELLRLARGIDERPVNPSRERKSLSNETTFRENLETLAEGLLRLEPLLDELADDYAARHSSREIRECFVKLKFEDFKTTTAQRASDRIAPELMRELLAEAWSRSEGRSVRLVGAGVRFRPEAGDGPVQLEMF